MRGRVVGRAAFLALLGGHFMSPRDFKRMPTPAAAPLCLFVVGNQATHLADTASPLSFPFEKRSTELSSEDARLLAFDVQFWNSQRVLCGTLFVVREIFVVA